MGRHGGVHRPLCDTHRLRPLCPAPLEPARHAAAGLDATTGAGIGQDAFEDQQVAAGAAAEIEDAPGPRRLDMAQQGGDVLADVVVLCAFQKILG